MVKTGTSDARPAEYLEFISLFNRGKFFEAHEVLELLWRREKGGERDFYHGLIQIAAAFVHIQKGTPEGGKKLLVTATQYLEKYLPARDVKISAGGTRAAGHECLPARMGLDLKKLLAETGAALAAGRGFPQINLRP